MRITIDTHAATPAEMGICIATLVACGAESAAEVPPKDAFAFDAQACRQSFDDTFHKVPALVSFDLWQYVWKKAHRIEAMRPAAEIQSATALAANLSVVCENLSDIELIVLVRELNVELASRRISPLDNPATGADAAALNSDASWPFTKDELTAKFNNEIVKPLLAPMVEVVEKLDLAGVFGGAGGGVVSDDAAKSFAHEQLGEPFVAGTVTLDKAGIPWDSRIHSASKSINQTDGLWRQKRGVSPELVATVVGQLKQAQSVPAPTGVIVMEPDDETGKLVPVPQSTAVKIPPPPPVAAAPSAPPPPPPADTSDIDSLPRLLKFITEQKLAGKINQAQVQQALIALGIEGPLPVLQSRPDLIPEMVKKLRAIGGL